MNLRTRPAKMADIARLAGVSVPTVSYILNGRAKERHLSQATAERVMTIARDLGYVRNTVARNLRKQSTRSVSILLSDLERGWASHMLRGALEVFAPRDYHVSISAHFWDPDIEQRELQVMAEEQRAAIIIRPMVESSEAYQRLLDMGIPIVLLDELREVPKAPAVYWDPAEAIRRIIAHLAAAGRRRIGLFSVDRGTKSADRILEGFRQGLRDFGLQANPNWLMLDRRYALKRLPNGRVPGYGTRLREVFSGPGPHPDALIGTSDALACTAITYLQEDFGLRVPEDILVAGLGNLDDSAIVGLTSAPEPVEAIGREAAKAALAQIDGEATSGCVLGTSEVYYRRTTEPPELAADPTSQDR